MNAEALNIMSEAMRKLFAVAKKAWADGDPETYTAAMAAMDAVKKACIKESKRRLQAGLQPPSQIVVQMPAYKAEPLVSQEVIDWMEGKG